MVAKEVKSIHDAVRNPTVAVCMQDGCCADMHEGRHLPVHAGVLWGCCAAGPLMAQQAVVLQHWEQEPVLVPGLLRRAQRPRQVRPWVIPGLHGCADVVDALDGAILIQPCLCEAGG